MKIALITGGSRGLGRSSALHLAKEKVAVLLTYHTNKMEADKVVAEIERLGGSAASLQLDIGNSKTFGDFAAQVGRTLKQKWNRDNFDFLVNNAGTSLHASFMETTEEQFDGVVNVHFKGTFFLSQKLVPLMADGGRIINTSSGLARFAFQGSSAYGSIKAAVESLTRYMAVELGPRRITVNTIAPGPIATDFSGGAVRDTPALNQHLASLSPLKRVGEADDIGGMVMLLLAEESRWLNGQRIEVAGGIL